MVALKIILGIVAIYTMTIIAASLVVWMRGEIEYQERRRARWEDEDVKKE